MTEIYRVRTVVTGLTGGQGLSTHYFLKGTPGAEQDLANLVQAFWEAGKAQVSSGVGMQVQNVVDTLDTATGALVSSGNVTATTPTSGSNSSGRNPAATQGLMRLQTVSIVAGRRIRGKIFLPGAPGTSLGADETPTGTYQSVWASAGAGLVAGADLVAPWVVWSRAAGEAYAVDSVNIWNKWAVLRSRRD